MIRRSLLAWLGLAPAAAVVASKSEAKGAAVYGDVRAGPIGIRNRLGEGAMVRVDPQPDGSTVVTIEAPQFRVRSGGFLPGSRTHLRG